MISISKWTAFLVIIAMLFLMMLGFFAGMQYQKEQPVSITVQAWTKTDEVSTQTYMISPRNTLSLPLNSYFTQKNNISVWEIWVAS